MRVGNKGSKHKRRKRSLRIVSELRHIDDKRRRGHGWAAKQAAKIANRRSYQGSVFGSKYLKG